MSAMAGMAAAGGVLGAVGNLQQADAQKKAANYNAGIMDDNAAFSLAAGEDQAQQALKAGREARSSIRANAGASGVQVDTGSPLLVQREAIVSSTLDAARAKYAAEVQATGYKKQAALYRFSGKQAQIAGYFGAASSLLGGGANATMAQSYANRAK